METKKVRIFSNYLAINRRVSVATQNQALNDFVFFFKHVIKNEDVKTTMIYSHVMKKQGIDVKSPLDNIM